MRTSLHLLKVCVAVAVLATVAQALAQGQGQGGGRNRGGFGRGGISPMILIQAEPVQKELELSDDQKASVTKLADEARQAGGGGGGGGGGGAQMTAEERQQRRDDQMKKIDAILLPNQQERFEQILLQISMQSQAATALTETKVAEKLQLTDDQKKQLQVVTSDYQQKMQDLRSGGGRPDRDAMTKLNSEQSDKAMAVLTSDQKDQLTKLEGSKFDVDMATLMRGAFGNRGQRNGGNGGNGGGNGGNGGKGQPDA